MGVKATSMSPNDAMHPSNFGSGTILWIAPTSNTWFVAAIALNAAGHAPGANLTLVIGTMIGTGQSVKFTPSAAITATYEIQGTDHLGRNRTERIVFAASAAVQFTKAAYKFVSRVTVISDVDSAETISVGMDSNLAGNRLGIPIILQPWAIPIATPIGTGELKALIDQLGFAIIFEADAAGDPAYNAEFGTLKCQAAANPGPVYCSFQLLPLGHRP